MVLLIHEIIANINRFCAINFYQKFYSTATTKNVNQRGFTAEFCA